MGYKDTVSKLERVLSKIETAISDFKIEEDVYINSCEKGLDSIEKAWIKKDTGVWYFRADVHYDSFLNIGCASSSALVPRGEDMLSQIDLVALAAKNKYKLFKKEIVKSLLQCMSYGKTTDLDLFSKQVLESAKAVEASLTQDFYSFLYDTYSSMVDGYNELANRWSDITNDLKEYFDRADQLIDQAAAEWYTKDFLKPGVVAFVTGKHTEYTIVDISDTEIRCKYSEGPRPWGKDVQDDDDIYTVSLDSVPSEAKRYSWLLNNPQFKEAISILNPLDRLTKYLYLIVYHWRS